MDAIILSAGRGERLRPLTDRTPKPLVQIGRLRLIEYSLSALGGAGVRNVVVNCAHLADQFQDFLGDGEKYGVNIKYSIEAPALETGGGVFKALPLINSDPFIVINGDIWTSFTHAWQPLANELLGEVILVDNPDFNLKGDFALDDHKLANPDPSQFTYTYSGIAMLRKAFFGKCQAGRFSLTPLLRDYTDAGLIGARHFRGDWFDCGSLSRLRRLQAHLRTIETT